MTVSKKLHQTQVSMNKETCNPFERLAATQWTVLNTSYVVFEVVIAIFATIGNILVFLVFFRDSKLRHKINFYIISLAISDFGIGLIGIPFGISVVS